MAYEMIQARIEGGKVGVVTLNRPKQLNALNDQLMDEMGDAVSHSTLRRTTSLSKRIGRPYGVSSTPTPV